MIGASPEILVRQEIAEGQTKVTIRPLAGTRPRGATPEQIRDAVQAWLMRQAKTLFQQRLAYFAPQLQVQWRRLSLSNAGTRWGSARVDGAIRLNWRLVHFSLAVVDYVVAHELSHLRVMNHSPHFWQTVGSVMPDYPERPPQSRASQPTGHSRCRG